MLIQRGYILGLKLAKVERYRYTYPETHRCLDGTRKIPAESGVVVFLLVSGNPYFGQARCFLTGVGKVVRQRMVGGRAERRGRPRTCPGRCLESWGFI